MLNVHERRIEGADAAALRRLVGQLGTSSDRLWPSDRWPPMRLDRGVQVGSHGGHGTIRYRVEAVDDAGVTFRFDPAIGLDGTHRIEIVEVDGAAGLRHVIDARTTGCMRWLWPLLIEPLHDTLIEDAFDGAPDALAGRPPRRRALPAAVRWRRRAIEWVVNASTPRSVDRTADLAAAGTATTLFAIGALHAAWGARVTTWPGRDARHLAEVVVGGTRVPSRLACYAVAGLLGAASAALLVQRRAEASPPLQLASHGAARVVGATLATRGVAGLVVSALGLGSAAAEFRRNDLLLYSPLCLVLAYGARRASRR